jgi:hypothetical protein
MSYEGHIQVLCENGHYHVYDAYDAPQLSWRDHDADAARNYSNDLDFLRKEMEQTNWACPDCEARAAWFNSVDDTNGDGEDVCFVEKTAAVRETCNLGHVHVTRHATYEVPQGVGHIVQHDDEFTAKGC